MANIIHPQWYIVDILAWEEIIEHELDLPISGDIIQGNL